MLKLSQSLWTRTRSLTVFWMRVFYLCLCLSHVFKIESWFVLFFKKNFGGQMSFYGAIDTPVLDFWWCLLWVSKVRVGSLIHTWQIHMWCTFPEIHLWSDTCQPPDGQYRNWSLFPTCVSVEVRCHIQTGDLPHSSLMC